MVIHVSRRTAASSLVALLLLLAACGSGTAGSSRRLGGSTPRSQLRAVEVVYDAKEHTSEGRTHFHADVVLAGDDQVRVSFRETGMAPMLFVRDGDRLMVHDPEEIRPWKLYESVAEHPEELDWVDSWRLQPKSSAFERWCRSARVVGHKTILGRQAVGYHCAARHYADGSSESAFVPWLEVGTGLLLQEAGIHAISIDDNPDITGETFATTPPSGAKVAYYAAKKPFENGSKDAPDFHLKKLGGGTVSLTDYAGKPLVVAFFASDIVFDPHGEECRRCTPALLALQRDTAGKTSPAVLAIQSGDEGKPGFPLVPKGVRLDVANDPAGVVSRSYGVDAWVGFAFIGSDGKVARLFDKPPSDQQLQEALDALD
jgi:peroxiredoxin